MHVDEYRARGDGLQQDPTVEDLGRQVRELKADKGFDVVLEQGLAYPTSEVGKVARGVLRPPPGRQRRHGDDGRRKSPPCARTSG